LSVSYIPHFSNHDRISTTSTRLSPAHAQRLYLELNCPSPPPALHTNLELTHPLPSPTPCATQFLCYKTLKKCLKNIPEEVSSSEVVKPGVRRQLTEEERAFVKTLNQVGPST